MLAARLALLRPFTLLAPVVGTAATAGVASAALARPWATPALALACVAAATATGASNAWNQAFDAGIDRVNRPHRPIPAGLVSERAALFQGDLLALAALLAAASVSTAFLSCVAIGVLGTWIYSAPPLRTKRHPVLALVTIAIPRGLLVPVAGWSVVAPPTASDPWALGVVSGLYVLGAAATKDFADVAGDRAHGCRTLPILLGAGRAARVVAPFLALPFLLHPVFGALGLLAPPVGRLVVLAAVLFTLGGVSAVLLLRDAEGLGSRQGAHPAWIGMYLTLLVSQVGAWVAYAA